MFMIRPFEPQRDAPQAYNLWQQTLGQLWPPPNETFLTVAVNNPAYRLGDHLVASSDGEIVGLIATQTRQQ